MIILAVLSLVGGFIELPENFGPVHLFSDLVNRALPVTVLKQEEGSEILFQLLSAIVSIIGVFIAYLFFYKKNLLAEKLGHSRLSKFLYQGFGFDWLYNKLVVDPVVWFCEIDKNDFVDLWSKGLASLAGYLNGLLSLTQNGKLRWYAMALVIGIVLILTIMLKV